MHFEADSPRAPVSSEKLVSDRSSPRSPHSPRVTIFKTNIEKPKPVLDRSFAYSGDFTRSRADESVMTITGMNSTSYTTDMFDYLPKDQLSEMESQCKAMTPMTERSQSSLQVHRHSASFEVHRAPCLPNATTKKTLEGLEHRRGSSRGLIAEFCDRIGKGRSGIDNVDDFTIQVRLRVARGNEKLITYPTGHCNN